MLALNLDRNEWRSFLDILGKDIKTVRLRSFFPKGHPLKATDHGKKSHANGDWIHRMQSEGRGVYIVVNEGGDTDSEITACRAFFCEWDDRPKEEQINAWKDLGLPQPSLQIDTSAFFLAIFNPISICVRFFTTISFFKWMTFWKK